MGVVRHWYFLKISQIILMCDPASESLSWIIFFNLISPVQVAFSKDPITCFIFLSATMYVYQFSSKYSPHLYPEYIFGSSLAS